MSSRLILWDFDGTLAMRPGLWSGCAMEVLDELEPGHGVELARIKAGVQGRFPWHQPEVAHPHLNEPERWWAPVVAMLASALEQAGVEASRARELAAIVRARFIATGWALYEDTLPALERAADAGWRSAILSNHVPELPAIAATLGLDSHVEHVFTSALMGYDKPHPELFRMALAACGGPEEVWMVGDNPVADVAGAEALGIPAVLVRTDAPAARRAPGLPAAVDLILADT